MREQVWLEWFCRQSAKTVKPLPETQDDPRFMFAIYVEQGSQALKLRSPDLVESLWYKGLRPFSVPYLGVAYKSKLQTDEAPGSHLALLVTRGTADLLGGVRAPVGLEQHWRAQLSDDHAIYIDVPHGAVLIGSEESSAPLQLRAVFLPSVQSVYLASGRPFIAVLTAPGSELPLGRLCGSLDADGRTSQLISQTPTADFTLTAPYIKNFEEATARHSTGEFIRLILAYYLFGPAEVRDTFAATPTTLLRKGKPRSDQGLFAITRLRATADRLGRPSATSAGSWSLTTRQEIAGHFKLQAYGPGASLRRLIWIESYERGREDGPVRPKAIRV